MMRVGYNLEIFLLQLLFSTPFKLLTLKTQWKLHKMTNTFKDILNAKNLTRSIRPKLTLY